MIKYLRGLFKGEFPEPKYRPAPEKPEVDNAYRVLPKVDCKTPMPPVKEPKSDIEKELERNLRRDIEKRYSISWGFPSVKQAEQNLSDFVDAMSQGPKYQERQRIEKLKSLAMFGVVDGAEDLQWPEDFNYQKMEVGE